MMDLDWLSTVLGSLFTLGGGVLVLAIAGSASSLAGAICILGILTTGLGLVRRSRQLVSVGATTFWIATVIASVDGLVVEGVLLAVFVTIVSWDAGRRAIDLRTEFPHNASTWRVEVVHGGSTVLVGGVSLLVATGLYHGTSGSTSVLAVALLSIATLLLLWIVRTL